MPTTSPDNIFYADGSTPMSAAAISAAEATSVQEALSTSRAIRTYRWTDSDARDAQIDMQPGDQGYQIDEGAHYQYDGIQWTRNESGLVLLRPTSVSGTGVSMSGGGKVTFTAAAEVILDGCFTSQFENYRIVFSSSTSANSVIQFRFRKAGVDAATGYTAQLTTSVTSTVTAGPIGSTVFGSFTATAALRRQMECTLFAPALPKITSWIVSAVLFGTNLAWGGLVGEHSTASDYDGLRIIPGAGGTMTGTMTVYGYND